MTVLEADVQRIEQAEFIKPVDAAELQTEYLGSLRRLGLDDYHWMISAGFFERAPIVSASVELINGALVEMSPNYPPHAFTVGRLNRLFTHHLQDRADVRCQQPITLPKHQSEPEPDIVLATLPDTRYMSRHPGPDEILLLCEVSQATLSRDRRLKFDLYARAGIREYWIVNLVDRMLEVYREPVTINDRWSFRMRLLLSIDERIAPLAFPDVEIVLSEIFPEREAD